MKKSFLLLLLMLCMIVGLASCNEKKPDEQDTDPVSGSVSETEEETDAPEPLGVAIGSVAAAETPVERFAAHPELLLWENGAPGDPKVAPTLVPYLTDKTNGNGTIILLQGIDNATGKYYASEGGPVAEHLNGLGYDVFICKYRITDAFSDQVTGDVRRAIRFVDYYSDEFGLEKQKTVLMGFGTGGLLAYIADCDGALGEKSDDEVDKMMPKVAGVLMVNTDINVTEGMFAGAKPTNKVYAGQYYGVFYETGMPDSAELISYVLNLKQNAAFGIKGTVEVHSIPTEKGYQPGADRTEDYKTMYSLMNQFLKSYIFK